MPMTSASGSAVRRAYAGRTRGADCVDYMVTRPRHTSVGELWIMPTAQV